MNRKHLIANKDVTTKDGQRHKAGDKFEADDKEAQDLIQRGDAKEDPASQGQK